MKKKSRQFIRIAGDLNTLFPMMYRTSKQKISKEIGDLSNAINQLELPDIFRFLHPKQQNIYFSHFSSTHEIFIMIYHMLGHKTSLNK